MKSRDTLLRLKRFQAEEKRRRVAQLEMMIAEFNRMAADLDKEIAAEEARARISDPTHFAYPTYARAARSRRDNLVSSTDELRGQLEEAKVRLDEALAEVSKAESLEGRDKAGERMHEVVRAADLGANMGASMSANLGMMGLRAARA